MFYTQNMQRKQCKADLLKPRAAKHKCAQIESYEKLVVKLTDSPKREEHSDGDYVSWQKAWPNDEILAFKNRCRL